jgi:hypothetical protein
MRDVRQGLGQTGVLIVVEISDVAIGAITQVGGSTTACCVVSYMKTLVGR